MPQLVKECVATHKLEGYEHMWIDNSNYHHCKYVDECVSAGLWGKATDYLRMYYLEQHGGIYLDADTEILKPFDDVLDTQMFVCEEHNYFLANGIVGSVAHHPVLVEYIKTVDENFIGSGALVFQPGMFLWTDLIKQGPHRDKVKIYSPEWFLPYNHQTGETITTENTHTMHYYLKSWIPK